MKKLLTFIIVLAYGASTMSAITIPNVLKVKLTSANNKSDEVTLYQAEDAVDTQFQNGKDATKINFPMGEPSDNVYIYVTRTYEQVCNLAAMYVTDLTGQYISLKTNATETNYTLSFPTVYPATFSVNILDWETHVMTVVAPGVTYSFTAAPDSTYTQRFQIVPTYSVTTNPKGWATYSNSLDLTPLDPSAVTLYKGEYASELLTLTAVSYAGANHGVVVKGAPSTTYTLVPVNPVVDEFEEGNDLLASVVETTLDLTMTNFCMAILNDLCAFYEYTGEKVKANKAYLSMNAFEAPQHIRMRIAAVETDVENVRENAVSVEKIVMNGQVFIKRDNRLYNLQGQLVK